MQIKFEAIRRIFLKKTPFQSSGFAQIHYFVSEDGAVGKARGNLLCYRFVYLTHF